MLSFTIWVTNKCNLKCTYCYEKNIGHDEKEKDSCINSVVDFIREKAIQYEKDEIYISFHGGEPLLEYNKIKQYIKQLKTVLCNRKFAFFMTTNGVLLDERKALFLNNNIGELSVSIDGCREAHNLNRVYPNGQGSYEDVMYNIEHSGLDKKNLRVRMTVTANNVTYLEKGIDNLVNRGFRCIVPAVAIEDKEWNEEKFHVLENELKKVKEKYHSNKNLRIAMIDKREMQKKAECVGGIKSFNILSNGDVYPCEIVAGNKDFCLGNITDLQIDEDKLRKIYRLKGCSDCQDCNYKIYCEGMRCKYVNMINTGSYHTPPDTLCEVENIKYRLYTYNV